MYGCIRRCRNLNNKPSQVRRRTENASFRTYKEQTAYHQSQCGTQIAGKIEVGLKSTTPSCRLDVAQQSFELDPNKLAAILYRPEDDIDTLLADFAGDLLRASEQIGGIVQRNSKDESGRQVGMEVLDLMTGRAISICQPLGRGATACKLDSAGLAEASLAVARAIEDDVALVIVNKFSKQEAAGHGLRSELADAILAGLPVLTAVPEKCIGAWTNFTGDRGTTLFYARHVIDAWWYEVSAREAIKRNGQLRNPNKRQIIRQLFPDHNVRRFDHRRHVVSDAQGKLVDCLVGDRREDHQSRGELDLDVRRRRTLGHRYHPTRKNITGTQLHGFNPFFVDRN